MNDLIFYTLIIALLYYFFIYLPQPKPTQPLTQSPATQTNPNPTPIEDNSELESTLDHLIQEIKQLHQSLK